MNNFKLKEREEFKVSLDNIIVYANDNKYILTLFTTDKRLVLLQDVNKQLTFNNFLNAKGISIPTNLEIVFEVKIHDIAKFTYVDGLNQITFKNNANFLKLQCEDLSKYLKSSMSF